MDDYDIDKRIEAANKSMGSLKHFWDNPYASPRVKQLIFLAMPANQLLWGCKSWALHHLHITKLEVFWHRSIQRILWIGVGQVIEERITNEKIRKIFINVLTAENTIVVRQMNYLGKIIRGPTNHPPDKCWQPGAQTHTPKEEASRPTRKHLYNHYTPYYPKKWQQWPQQKTKQLARAQQNTCSTRTGNSNYGSKLQKTKNYGTGTSANSKCQDYCPPLLT
jgi:hypothetical protein